MDGVLLVDKPSGWTSFDIVAKVRSILKKELQTTNHKPQTPLPKVKVGHTGTLDPLATGLLVLVVGSYTKRAGEFSKLDKTYEVTMKLGQTSTTGDSEGELTDIPASNRTYSDLSTKIETVFKEFEGEIMQTPPQYSAIKVDGQRAYKLARKGQHVELEPRKVTVYSLQVTEYSYPEVKFTAEVSSGTYIRSLVEDIGTKLNTGAYMSALRRTKVGDFKIEDAQQIKTMNISRLLTK